MFDEEYRKTSQKMADVVLEYAAQFIAEDYLEEYRRAKKRPHMNFVPKELDDKLYDKIDKLEKQDIFQRKMRNYKKKIKSTIFVIGCFAIAILIFVFSINSIRQAIFNFISI